MNEEISASLASREDGDIPATWKLFAVVALCSVVGAFLFSPTRGQIDEGIRDGTHWLQTSPRYADCGGNAGKSCSFGDFSVDRYGSGQDTVFILSKEGRNVASVFGGALYLYSGLNDAERTRIRTEFAKVVAH
ncbi:hypothetical protein D3C71_264440 [compost metagenome]